MNLKNDKDTEKKYYVYLSSDCVRGMLLETARHPGLECIIQMPGVRKENTFFFDMVADSGPHGTYTYGMCEKDHEYCDHLSTILFQYYKIPDGQETLSQFHKHPPDFTRFSHGDLPANKSLARQYGGVVNGLILVNPEFHLKMWYIDENGRETSVAYEVNDAAVRAAMPRKELTELKELVEKQEKEEHFFRTGEPLESCKKIKRETFCSENFVRRIRKIFHKKTDVPAEDVLEKNQELSDELSELSWKVPIKGKYLADGSMALKIDKENQEPVFIKITCEDDRYQVEAGGEKQTYYSGLIQKLLNIQKGDTVYECE